MVESPEVFEDVGDALFIAGYETRALDDHAEWLQHITEIGEQLLGSDRPWRIRRLAAPGTERDLPTRRNVRREIDALFGRPAATRLIVIVGEITRTLEGLALVCAPELGGFREDATVPLEWIGDRLRPTAAPSIVMLAARAEQSDPQRWLAALAPGPGEHLVVVSAAPRALLSALRDSLAHQATDRTGSALTPALLGLDLEGRLPGAALRSPGRPAAAVGADRAPRPATAAAAASTVTRESDDMVGSLLPGRFRIAAEIGRGSFAVVYRARQELVGRDVAIKVLRDHLPPDAVQRFLQETQTVARLDHRNIVRVFHADRTRSGRMFVAMELLWGCTLQQLLDDGVVFAPARAVAVASQLLAALATAHASGVIHADVKPANIFIENGDPERAVLLDFGLSRLRTATSVASVGGTPAYMAPEQIREGQVDASSDLYAAGLVLIAMLTGRGPGSPPVSAAEIDAIGDARLRTVLRRATAETQAARFASAGEMAAAITGEPVIGSPPRPPFRPAPFEETDHPDFFGRDREIKVLIEHVLFRRAVIYVAPSGTGKTSLLRAGMSPQLAKLGIRTVYVACRPGLPDGLADAITPGCTTLADAIVRYHGAAQRRLVIVIDQIEAALVGAAPHTVVEALGLADWPADAQVCVVLSVREEYLARLLDRTQRIEPGIPVVRLGPLGPDAAREALVGTLAARSVALDPELLDELLDDLERAAARLAVELGWTGAAIYPPHLQLAGAVLYEALPPGASQVSLALYRQLGGLDKIITEHLHHVLEGELSPEHTAIARDVLLALVTSSHTRATRAEPELIAIACGEAQARSDAAHAPRSPDAVRAVLAFLRDHGLLVAMPGSSAERGPLWDLAHDSLVQRIEAWITSTDLARLRALELVRYHLRRSDARSASLLGVDDLREIDAHLGRTELAQLDGEWAGKDRGGAPASTLVRASRAAIRLRRAALTAAIGLALGVAALLAVRWQDERAAHLRETRLRDRDIGHFLLDLTAFDWDPAALSAHARRPGDGLQLDWELHRPDLDDDDSPGAPLDPEDLERRTLPGGVALRTDAVAARGGPAVLVVHRREAGVAAAFCRDVVLPIRRLPGYAPDGAPLQRLSVDVPSCSATRAGLIEIPDGPFLAGGQGSPRTPYPDDLLPPETLVDVPRYWIDRTEVTVAAMNVFFAMSTLHGIVSAPRPDNTERYPDGQRYAAGAMTWREARAFCRYLGKDLPTMDQWDKALRGGLTIDGRPNPCPRRNFAWCGAMNTAWANVRVGEIARPLPVASNPHDISPYGVMDMVGNVQEWTRSPALPYHSFPASLPGEERARRQAAPGAMVITRGCNWGDIECASDPLTIMPIPNARLRDVRYFTLGMRCAVPSPPAKDLL